MSEPRLDILDKLSPLAQAFGKIYNDFEAEGSENIPRTGPALLVFYHGLIPLDAWYFGFVYYLQSGRMIRALVDRWVVHAPGLAWLLRAVGAVEGSPEAALSLLKAGHLVAVSPGGVREAISGKKNSYKLMWGDRKGFAKVALEAKVPIIPVFTENVDELYRAPFADRSVFQKIYEITKLPLVPILGLGPLPFPVKLKMWIGEPIPFDAQETPGSLQDKTRKAMEDLISKHQSSNPSVLKALRNRFSL